MNTDLIYYKYLSALLAMKTHTRLLIPTITYTGHLTGKHAFAGCRYIFQFSTSDRNMCTFLNCQNYSYST